MRSLRLEYLHQSRAKFYKSIDSRELELFKLRKPLENRFGSRAAAHYRERRRTTSAVPDGAGARLTSDDPTEMSSRAAGGSLRVFRRPHERSGPRGVYVQRR